MEPETPADGRGLRAQLRVSAVRDARFRRLIVPTAPWVFTTAGIAYALLPELVSSRLGSHVLIFATVMCVLTLGAGALVQPQVHRLNLRIRGHALSAGMATMTFGVVLSALACGLVSPVVALIAGVVLGVGFGICVVAGLGEVQRIAPPEQLAGMTGIYYSLAYLGFLLPTALAALSSVISYTVLLTCVACASALSLVRVGSALARGLA